MQPHHLNNFEIQNTIKTNLNLMVFIQEIVYLKKGGAYLINLEKNKSIGTHWIALHVNGSDVTYFASFRVKHIPI